MSKFGEDLKKGAEAPVHGVEHVGEGIKHEAEKVHEHFEHHPDQEKVTADVQEAQADV